MFEKFENISKFENVWKISKCLKHLKMKIFTRNVTRGDYLLTHIQASGTARQY